jgi:hypothetical protein
MATSAKTTDGARHAQMIACAISTPRASHPVTPKTKRPAMKTSAIGGLSEFHHQIVIAKLKNRDAVAKVEASNQLKFNVKGDVYSNPPLFPLPRGGDEELKFVRT